MRHVLKKCVRILIRISFAHPLFHGIGPGGDACESFPGLKNPGDFPGRARIDGNEAILPTA